MRVALVSSGPPSAHEVAALARSLTRDGTLVDVLGPGARGRGGATPYDVVHAVGARALATLLTLGWASPGRVATADEHAALWPRRRMLETADRIICRSKIEAARLTHLAPAMSSRVRVVAPAVDVVALDRARPLPAIGRTVLCLDRLDRDAQIDRAIAALAALDDDFALTVIGAGHARRALCRCADELGVRSRVRLMGPVGGQELPRWLVTAQVLVALGRRPAPAGLLLHALAAGTPVVAADVDGNREAIEHLEGAGATLVAANASPLMVADAVANAAGARVPRKAVTGLPTPEAVAVQTLAVYEEARRRRPRLLALPAMERAS
jgi:glycosyltransferase involved in cell wall biosynthesis